MAFLVAFDGFDLSIAALSRASELAETIGEEVIAVSVVPENPLYAVECGWVDDEREFDPESVAGTLRERAESTAPAVEHRIERVDAYAGHGTVARTIRAVAEEVDADVVFVGSDDAGRVTAPVTSVGDRIAEGTDYDVYIVRSD